MIASDEMLAALKPVEQDLQLVLLSKTKITDTIDIVGGLDFGVPIRNHRLVHMINITERSVAILDDILVEEMVIRCKIDHSTNLDHSP